MGGRYFSLFVTRLHSCLSVCLFSVHFNATIIIQNPVFPVKLVSSLCVFMFRPAIRTFQFIESVPSTSWVLVSTPCFFLFAGHDKAGKTKRGYLFTGQMCFILFATFPFFFPFFAFFLIFQFFSSFGHRQGSFEWVVVTLWVILGSCQSDFPFTKRQGQDSLQRGAAISISISIHIFFIKRQG